MQDIIFWGRNYDKFIAEALSTNSKLITTHVVTQEPILLFTSTPMRMNKRGEFMFLVRGNSRLIGHFARLSTVENLGGYEAVFLVPAKRAIYDRIYPNAPYVIISEGESVIIIPPERFGEFGGDI